MFSTGFLGSNAPMYMDIAVVYFAIFPFLLWYAIYQAIKKKYSTHYKLQTILFVVSLLVVVIFEVGVRVDNNFNDFMQNSNVNYTFMISFLIFHIFISIISLIMWIALLYGTIRRYIVDKEAVLASHKRTGYYVFAGLTLTSITGVMIYWFLFLYT